MCNIILFVKKYIFNWKRKIYTQMSSRLICVWWDHGNFTMVSAWIHMGLFVLFNIFQILYNKYIFQ